MSCLSQIVLLLLLLYADTVLRAVLAAHEAAASSTPISAHFRALVPNKLYFKEFVDCTDTAHVQGFCIDVFEKILPTNSTITYTCFPIASNDTYDTMISLGHEYDVVLGDITISAARLAILNFTQPYLDSGIVMLAGAAGVPQKFPGVFFKPFTAPTWGLIAVSPMLAGLALWVIERNEHPQLRRTEPRLEMFRKASWLVTSTLVFFKRESIKNPLAKCVMIAWILFILLIGSSYTASLSSILTVDVLTSSMNGAFDKIRRDNLSVGYQVGSIVKDYLTVRQNLSETNLIPLSSISDYASALNHGTVAVVVDEIPYISLFLAAQSTSDCNFTVSSKLTIEGFGYAFHNGDLAATFSVAILNLLESGDIKRLRDGWKLSKFECPSHIESTTLDLDSSEGLFIILGSAALACIVIFSFKLGIPYAKNNIFTTNVRQDAISAVEPNMHGWTKRWFSSRHQYTIQDEYA